MNLVQVRHTRLYKKRGLKIEVLGTRYDSSNKYYSSSLPKNKERTVPVLYDINSYEI